MVDVADIVLEGPLMKKSKHSSKYTHRSCVVSKDTFYVFKTRKKYDRALDKIPLDSIATIHTDENDDSLFIITDKENHSYFYKLDNKQSWIDCIKQQNADIIAITNRSNQTASSMSSSSRHHSTSVEITSNAMVDEETDSDMFTVPFDLYNGNRTDTEPESEIGTIDNVDLQILEEVDFFVIDLVHGYLRGLYLQSSRQHDQSEKKMVPQNIPNLCILFYFTRKFNIRKLKRNFDFC